jgi:hypothetical protein
MRPAAPRPALALVLALVVAGTGAACGRGGHDDVLPTTGRVMAVTEARYCISPDRGDSQVCLGRGRQDPGLEVGQCVVATPGQTFEANRFEVVDDARCAAGDLGDD